MAVLAVFAFSGTEAAAPTLNNPSIIPDDSRVDGSEPMQFTIEYEDADGDYPTSFKAVFDGVATQVDMVCAADETACNDGDDPDGTWVIADGNEPLANVLVASVGSDEIAYNFVASTDGEADVCYLACDAWVDSNVRVNTVPVLSDDASVSGGGMPEDDYTLTVTYTDADNHAGTVTATVCDTGATCEDVTLSTADSDFTDGAIYSATFNTELGGTLTVTVSATDTHDSAVDDRTTTFTVNTETPWLKNAAVSATTAGEEDDVTFTVVYCVFDTTDQDPVSVKVDVGASSYTMVAGGSNSDCKNGVDYALTTTVGWASEAQDIVFWGSNSNDDAEDIEGFSITVNDAPTLSAGSAVSDADNFVLSVTAADINSDDGDAPLSVYASIEFDDTGERLMSCTGGDCSVTVAEADIRDQRGGIRSVTFRVEDTVGASTSGDFGNSIDVTKTSSFVLTGPGDQSSVPGSADYVFTVVNNGNFEDTFTISASSLNSWVSGSSDTSVTIAYGGSDTFTIVMDVPHVASGTTDSWSADVTAGNDDTQTDSNSGTTTVAVVSGHTVSIADSSSNADPGATATYYFTVTNTGNADESFAYTTDGSPSSDSTASLGMGESETVAVSHIVPGGASAGDSFTLTFTSGSESASATTTTNQIYGVSISQSGGSEPSTINPGDSFTIEYTVTNTGNGADSVSVSFNAAWLSGNSGTSLGLAAGASGTATATLTVPDDAASSSSSSISASATGAEASADSGSYSMSVNSESRSLSLVGVISYTVNQDSSTEGTVTVTNNGVTATFVVTAMSDKVTFADSEITLASGASGDMTFTLYAGASGGPFSFTIADTIDGSSEEFSGTVTARMFDMSSVTESTDDCVEEDVTCSVDENGGWDGTKYTKAGIWSTTKTVVDEFTMSGTKTFDTNIPNVAPSFDKPSLDDATAGTPQTFTFSLPSDSDGTITHVVIEFGDGNSQTFEGANLDGLSSVTHTYESACECDVVATAYDNSGGSTVQAVSVSVGERTVAMEPSSYTYNLVALVGFFVLGILLAATAFKTQQGEIAGDEEMNERDQQRLESVERRMESLAEREELLEVSAYDASRAATKLEEHISAFNEVLVRAQEIAAEEKLKELEVAEETRAKEEEQMQLDLEDPDIEMVAERFHESLGRLVKARDELSKIEEQLAHILKMERDEQLEKLTSMTESYEKTKRKIDALQSSQDARNAAADENNIMNLLSAAASGGSASDFGDFGDFGDSDEFEVEIYEDEDGSFYYIDPDTGEEVPCDEDGNAL